MKLFLTLTPPTYPAQEGQIKVDGENVTIYDDKFDINRKNLKRLHEELILKAAEEIAEIDWLGEPIVAKFNFYGESFFQDSP